VFFIMSPNSFIGMTKVYKSHKFPLALNNKRSTFLPLIYSKNFPAQLFPHNLIMKYTSCNKNSLRQLKTASENLPIQQNFFLILAEFRREKAKYYAGCFQHIDGVRLLNFREAFRHAQQNFRSSENLLHDEASQSKNVTFEIWDCPASLCSARNERMTFWLWNMGFLRCAPLSREWGAKIQEPRIKSQESRVKNQESRITRKD